MRVNELKWKVLHVHACFMLKPYICLRSRTPRDFDNCVRACVRVCVKMMTSEVCGIDCR